MLIPVFVAAKCAGLTSCMVFMPRIDLWAVETSPQAVEESDSISTNDQKCHEKVIEKENISGPQKCKSSESAGEQGVTQRASSSWSLFVEQVESLRVSTSLMILVFCSLSLYIYTYT